MRKMGYEGVTIAKGRLAKEEAVSQAHIKLAQAYTGFKAKGDVVITNNAVIANIKSTFESPGISIVFYLEEA